MNVPKHYENDVLYFFDGMPDRLALYQVLDRELLGWLQEAWDFCEAKGRGSLSAGQAGGGCP